MTSLSSADVLSSVQGERLDPLLAAVSSAALVIKSSIDLPMMLDIGSLENCNPLDLIQAGTCDVLSSHWQANGTSPVSIAMAIDAGTLSQTHFAAQALAQNPDLTPADLMNPKQWLGLDIKADNGQVLDADQHLTQYNPVPKLKGLQTAQVLITVPNPDVVNAIRAQQLNLPIELLPSYAKLTKPAQGWPVAMYGHGITFSKETVHGMAGAMALQGLATISIDLPMHGERGVDLNGDGVFEVSATDPSFGPSYVNGSMFAFVNLSSMLSIRDNLRQGSADMLSLRAAISNTGLTEIAQGQPPLLDATQVSYFGHSLGAIVGLPAVAVANTPFTLPDGTELANPFVFNSIAMVTPTAGYVPTAMFSPDFGVKVKVGLTSSDAFQLELSKVSGLTAEQLAGLQQTQPDHYAALVDSLYAEFRQQLTFAAQQVVDGGDPINFAALLTQTGTPALVHEIVGNGADNLSDMVLANSVAAEGWPVAGTEPLIAALNLQGIENTSQDANGIHGAVRLMYGHHLSIVSPAAVEGIAPDPIRNAQTSALIHQQLAEFLASAGTSLTINSLDAVIIAPAR